MAPSGSYAVVSPSKTRMFLPLFWAPTWFTYKKGRGDCRRMSRTVRLRLSFFCQVHGEEERLKTASAPAAA